MAKPKSRITKVLAVSISPQMWDQIEQRRKALGNMKRTAFVVEAIRKELFLKRDSDPMEIIGTETGGENGKGGTSAKGKHRKR